MSTAPADKLSELEERIERTERQNVLLWSALGISLAFLVVSRRRFVGKQVVAERFLLVDNARMFGSKKVMAELSMTGVDNRVALRMKKGSLTILNAKNEPAIILDSELIPPRASEVNNYHRTLHSLSRQPVIVLNDLGEGFTTVQCNQKSE